eukprot:TRINITY_DN4420_c0_g1_i1.p1 TRINITY_DN4420_c0_g1~~TRINITY_DN4420_c0_g1_i1.p1  ORF type:complete len:239 (-),score=26.75 TRINITY_DN4420_c0_g1_i1:179-895(-)
MSETASTTTSSTATLMVVDSIANEAPTTIDSNPKKTKLEAIRKLYQRTPPFPCNWPHLLCMLAEMKILERESNKEIVSSCPQSTPTGEHLSAKAEKNKLEIEESTVTMLEQLRQLKTLREQLNTIRCKHSSENHQKYVELLEDAIVSQKFEPCVICLEDPQKPVLTPCGHIYCYACIAAALSHYRYLSRPFCPVCRDDLDRMSDLVEIPQFKIVKVKPFPWPWNWGKRPELVLPVQQR